MNDPMQGLAGALALLFLPLVLALVSGYLSAVARRKQLFRWLFDRHG